MGQSQSESGNLCLENDSQCEDQDLLDMDFDFCDDEVTDTKVRSIKRSRSSVKNETGAACIVIDSDDNSEDDFMSSSLSKAERSKEKCQLAKVKDPG